MEWWRMNELRVSLPILHVFNPIHVRVSGYFPLLILHLSFPIPVDRLLMVCLHFLSMSWSASNDYQILVSKYSRTHWSIKWLLFWGNMDSRALIHRPTMIWDFQAGSSSKTRLQFLPPTTLFVIKKEFNLSQSNSLTTLCLS